MQITHGARMKETVRVHQHRVGEFRFRRLLTGTPGTPGNFVFEVLRCDGFVHWARLPRWQASGFAGAFGRNTSHPTKARTSTATTTSAASSMTSMVRRRPMTSAYVIWYFVASGESSSQSQSSMMYSCFTGAPPSSWSQYDRPSVPLGPRVACPERDSNPHALSDSGF